MWFNFVVIVFSLKDKMKCAHSTAALQFTFLGAISSVAMLTGVSGFYASLFPSMSDFIIPDEEMLVKAGKLITINTLSL